MGKHSKRNLVAPPPPATAVVDAGPRKRRVWPWLVAVAVVGFVIYIDRYQPSTDGEPILKVTASRGMRAMSFTNRESGSISRCRVKVLDAGDVEWTAEVVGTVVPSQSVTVAWSAFRSNDQPMPDSIGQSRNDFTVSCFLADEGNTHSAGIHF